MVEGLKEFFEELEDSRQDWKVKHSLYEILMVTMCGVAANGKSILEILEIASCKEQWLRDKLKLDFPNGFPSYDTVRRVLGMINPKKFEEAFIRFMEHTLSIPEGSYVSIDGKTLRGSGNKENEIEPLHLLHAYSYECGVVIGQLECHKAKTNEIPVSKELVDMLKLKDTVITADAMLCQKEVIAKIAKNNDYIIAIKGNQRYMFEGVKELFECKAEKEKFFTKTFNKGHGRIETRKYTLDTNIDWLDNRKEWKNIKAFVMCESVVISKGKERIERRYFITSLTDVKKVAKGIRSHWETREQPPLEFRYVILR